MFEQVQLILFNLLQYKRALQDQARVLATWRHNADLCPSVQWQCEEILATIERHRSVVYDTQGPGDAGTDVLIALDYKEETRYIGFQIKSDVEVSKDTLKTLKAQWVDAQNRFDDRLLDYYILLAWDPKLRAQAIRSVSQTFSTTRRVHVIEPAYLWTFLNGLSRFQMQALITAYLSDEDPLIRRAKTAVADLSPTQLALLTVFLEAHAHPESPPITLDNLYPDSFLRQMYRQSSSARLYGMDVRAGIELPSWLEQLATEDEDPWTQLAEDLDALEPWVYQTNDGRYELEVTESLTLLSLAYEGRARYGHSQDDLCSFLYQLLRTPTESAAANEPWATAVYLFLLVYGSELPDAKQPTALAELLELNCPQLAEEARHVEGGEAMDWDGLASELLRRAWERTQLLDDAGAHRSKRWEYKWSHHGPPASGGCPCSTLGNFGPSSRPCQTTAHLRTDVPRVSDVDRRLPTVRGPSAASQPAAPKARSGGIVTCESRKRRRSRPLRRCPWLSAGDRSGLL